MFTGIVEEIGEVVRLERENANLHLYIRSSFANELKIDQSVAHNGVCLTVVAIEGDTYKVTAIAETLAKTHLGSLKVGDAVNLERGMLLNTRLDGHIVQGHIDQTATCVRIQEEAGSTRFSFEYDASSGNVVIEKGSITVNGVSLTVVDAAIDGFGVAVIPYTLAHTNLHLLKVGSVVNVEFDVIGKYVARLLQR
ncbi:MULTISPECIES: riboflavin synthase [Capnocytophaga]|mgnify:FL=1|jgi:riboflavin synthase, alpha subunit|uniref:riboflavin synthase n=1 Tax=Capnocytophaga sp. oral taxon 332 TaxID=712213 RepID=UPI0002A3D7E0|nr:riboflavin synthase [Capnocytophaga sp. oral taxon 332]EKY12383.1 riboflavin synthase, alpha subunit [Capnocytophaga sp. oral taxon 332 str. F0381]